MTPYRHQKDEGTCRFCGDKITKVFADLGESPLANSFLSKEQLDRKEEKKYPLKVFVCENCLLVQLQEYESPKNIFSEYAYFSSYSSSWLTHCEDYATKMVEYLNLGKDNNVVEIASNDGYLLQFFKKKGIPTIGIEPAANIARDAAKKDIPTIVRFFDVNLAEEVKSKNKQADLLIANNVLAHVPDINDFVQAMKIILKPSGVLTVEFPHLLQLILSNQFDTIYHEHFSYFSLITIQRIFESHGLSIFDVEEIPTHGGSLRIYVKHAKANKKDKNNQKTSLENVLVITEKEKLFGLEDISFYTKFNQKITSVKKDIQDFFISAKHERKKIVCYGAAAKGNTLLNYCKIRSDQIEYVVDKNPHKQGLYTPGSHLQIWNPEKIKETKPDYVVILPWNLRDEIIDENSHIREWGGKFVILIPKVVIL